MGKIQLERQPCVAVVAGDVQARFRTRNQQAAHVGIRPNGPGKLIRRKSVDDLLPGLAAVFGAEDPALVIRPCHVTQRGEIHQIRILRVYPNCANLLRVPRPIFFQVWPASVDESLKACDFSVMATTTYFFTTVF